MSSSSNMGSAQPNCAAIARKIRHILKNGGSAEHAEGVQWFFKDEIKSHGWYTGELRRAAMRAQRKILDQHDPDSLLQVADKLFSGRVLEEKVFAVFLLEKSGDKFGDYEFRMFESWIDRISSWTDHDGLVHYLIAPMIVASPARMKHVLRWARSPDRWRRRAACVVLIWGTQRKLFFSVVRLSQPAFVG
jgi:3-methyladenine DNA glycosylase AlkD